MIERKQYRGCLKEGVSSELLENALAAAKQKADQLVQDHIILSACLYRYHNMCFLYYEFLVPDTKPEDFLESLAPFLELWPEEEGKTPWAFMYHIYHHSVPHGVAEWENARNKDKKKIGKIAFLYPEKLFSYTYWHQVIVDEGLFKGDQYQCISLHENILFAYYEEPKNMVNIKNDDVHESKAIEGWTNANPESHFDRVKAGGNNFILMDAVLTAGR